MDFFIKKNKDYADVTVYLSNQEIELGLHDKDEIMTLVETLEQARFELIQILDNIK